MTDSETTAGADRTVDGDSAAGERGEDGDAEPTGGQASEGGDGDRADAGPYETLRSDPELAALIEDHGELSIDPADDVFRRFVVSILRQQVSMAAAAAIRERLFDAVEVTPAGILAADESTLREAGLSGQKVEYVRSVARAFRERDYDADAFGEMDDAAVVEELTAIRGVGEWTAKMFLLFCLGREDVFPVEDLGIRKGMRNRYGEDLDREEMLALADRWRPYRSYAALYVWKAQDE